MCACQCALTCLRLTAACCAGPACLPACLPAYPPAQRPLADTTLPPHCQMVMEQGFGVFQIVPGVTEGTADDSAVYYNVQSGKQPDEAAFQIPSFCPRAPPM
eukprot:COSAG06_NODE_1162_length_10456_cov_56.520614_12_plen_102_part_00